jgi:hypothetical protein
LIGVEQGANTEWTLTGRGGHPGLTVSSKPAPEVEVCAQSFKRPYALTSSCGGLRVPVWPQAFAAWLVGRLSPEPPFVEKPQLIIDPVPQSRAQPIQIPQVALDAWRDGNQYPFHVTVTLSSDAPVVQIVVPPSVSNRLRLSASLTVDDPDRDRDRELVLETLVGQTMLRTISWHQSPRPETAVPPLAPGTYRLCGRLFDYQVTGCDGPRYELLHEPISIDLNLSDIPK